MIFRKLRTRMIAHIIWIVITITIISFFFLYLSQQKSMKQQLKYDADIYSDILEQMIINAMLYQGCETLPELLQKFDPLKHIKHIRILHLNNKVIYSSKPNEQGNIINNKYLHAFISHKNKFNTIQLPETSHFSFLRLTKIKNSTSCQNCHNKSHEHIGVLWIETTNEYSRKTIQSNNMSLAGVSISIIILLSLVTTILFFRSVDKPINSLKITMDLLEQGDFTARVQFSGKDELGQLAQGMNTLAEKLQKAKTHLIEHHKQELLQAEALVKIGKFAAGLAHEIKNPISGIVFAINSILLETDLDKEKREIFEEIVIQANRVEQNLESLLNIAKQSRLKRVSTNLNSLIERSILFINQQPNKKAIKTECNLDNNIPLISVDTQQIEQVLFNLMINAVQAMPNGGNLIVSTYFNQPENKIQIIVKDTGIGISKEFKNNIFQPFFTAKTKGVGLGLTLCQEIITRHYGKITFESKLNIGTTFTIEIPVNNI